MYTAIVLLVSLAVASAAPVDESRTYYLTRSKKSSGYGAPAGYGAPPCHSEGSHLAPIALYLAPQQVGHYRAEEDEKPSESQHHPEARSYYESGSALSSLASAAAGAQAAAGAPAIGVFPNANLGGCAIPLLLSCSPSIVKGHIVPHKHASAPSVYGAPAYTAPAASQSYREGGQTSETKENQKSTPMTQKAWEAQRASDLQSEHMPTPVQHEHHHLMMPVAHQHHMVSE